MLVYELFYRLHASSVPVYSICGFCKLQTSVTVTLLANLGVCCSGKVIGSTQLHNCMLTILAIGPGDRHVLFITSAQN